MKIAFQTRLFEPGLIKGHRAGCQKHQDEAPGYSRQQNK
jgi:hypothetical protein